MKKAISQGLKQWAFSGVTVEKVKNGSPSSMTPFEPGTSHFILNTTAFNPHAGHLVYKIAPRTQALHQDPQPEKKPNETPADFFYLSSCRTGSLAPLEQSVAKETRIVVTH